MKRREEFPKELATELLVKCRRRCCICHKFCGTKIEIHHIDGAQNNTMGNAIALCFDCHAEVGHYNSKHPKGKKYSAEELRLHCEHWIETCENGGYLTSTMSSQYEPGLLEALANEFEFNQCLWKVPLEEIGTPFEVAQFDQCMLSGAFNLLEDPLRNGIYSTYRLFKKVNLVLSGLPQNRIGNTAHVTIKNEVHGIIRANLENFEATRDALFSFIFRGSDDLLLNYQVNGTQ